MADPIAEAVFETVTSSLNSINPSGGTNTALIQAMRTAADGLAQMGVEPVDSCGNRILASRSGVDAAAAAAAANGEPGNYIGAHDAYVYTPEQMLVTLHRQLLGLGWDTSSLAATTVTPDPSPNVSNRAGVLMWPDISDYQSTLSLAAVKSAGCAGVVIKIGQGAGRTTDANPQQTYGQTLTNIWPALSAAAKAMFSPRFMGYWYVGNIESASSQAARCKAALGDLTIPVMLDWEDGSGEWSNLINVLRAFQAAGINVTALYTFGSYAANHGASAMDSLGLAIVRAHEEDKSHLAPSVLYGELPSTYWASFSGGTPDAIQFSAHAAMPGYSGDLDFNVFRGTMDQLAAMFQGGGVTTQPTTTVPPGATPPIVTPASWRACLDRGWNYAHQSTPWNRDPQSLPLPQIVDMSKQAFPGKRVGSAFAAYLPGGCKRIEVQPNIAEYTEGNEAWFGFSFILARNFPISQSFWHVICQLKNDGDGSPPVSLQVKNGHLVLTGGYGHPVSPAEYDVNAIPVSALTWNDIQFHVKFSRFATTGYVDVWANGNPVITNYHPPTGTLYPVDASNAASQSSYLKYGLYRDPTCPTDATVYHAGWAIGPQHGSVLLPAAG